MAKILVVDDEESIRFTFSRFLEAEGHEIKTAENYQTALALIDSFEADLIFLDIILGRHTGLDFLRDIRQKGVVSPVIMITGEPSYETATTALRLGAYDYLQKPIKKDQLLKTVRLALEYRALKKERNGYLAHLEAIFQSVQDGIITCDEKYLVTQSNKSFFSILNRQDQEVIGKSIKDILQPPYREMLGVIDQVMKDRKPEKQRFEFRSTNHRVQNLVVSGAPLVKQNGRFLGAVLVVRDVTRLQLLERELGQRMSYRNMIGVSNAMQKIYHLLDELKSYDTTVLITGESGTGKERVAEALHYSGSRAEKPFIKVNCSALVENLLESELFGHLKGSLTGAIGDKIGRFSMANRGTIFLDEIGDLSPTVQLKLLRVLQEREVERVGSTSTEKVDVRVIAATNNPLFDLVQQGHFSEDLYYRLKVVEIVMPPLRERAGDIPLLIDHFISRFNEKYHKDVSGITSEAQKILLSYSWPGNIRELENSIEHAFVLCHTSFIGSHHLPTDIRIAGSASGAIDQDAEKWEKEDLVNALKRTDWNKAKAARILGISRKTIYRKLERYQIITPEE